jgi:hypothetical protein
MLTVEIPMIDSSSNEVHGRNALGDACRLAWLLLAACGPTIPPPVDSGNAPAPSTTAPPETAPSEATSTEVSAGAPLGVGARTSACGGTPADNVTTGGTPSASDAGERPEQGPAALFDDHTGTKWSETTSPTPWIAYDLPAEHVVEQYAVSPVPDGPPTRDPVSWRLEGSNDEGATPNFTTLHAQQGQHFVSRQATMWYTFPNTRAFRRYRFVVTENGGGPGVELAELGLYGAGSPQFSVDDALRGKGLYQFQYSPGWEGHGTGDAEFHPAKYGHSSSWSKKKDEFVTFTFEGSRIEVFGVRFPGHGIAGFSMDGGPEVTADFYGENSGNVLFYTSDPLCPPGRHVLRIHPTGEKNPKSVDTFISIDRVRVTP